MKKAPFLYQICLLFVFALSSVRLFSQPPVSYTFEFFNSSHGLPSSEINTLAKDEKGFLWVGTAAGLSRYDGYTFHNYFYAEGNELIGVVKKIVADKQNRLWIGSGAGLFCYHNNKIVKINTATAAPQSVNDILPDTDGGLWLATGLGPVKINPRHIDITGQKKIILQEHIIPQWNASFRKKHGTMVIRIAKANDGTVYFSHFTDIFRLSENTLEWIYTDTVPNNNIISLFPVSKARIYYDAEATEMNVVENGKATRLGVHKIVPAAADSNNPGFWYIGTSGLYYFHPELGVASQHINTMEKNIFIPNAFLKEDGFFWVASFDGLVKIMPSYFTSHTVNAVTRHPDFYSFLQLKNGKLLAGNNRGIVLEEKEYGFTVYKKNLVSKAEIKALFEDERGWLWAGSGYQGLTLVKPNSIVNYTKQDGLHDNSLYAFLPTKAGKLYTFGDAGMTEIIVDHNYTVSFKKYSYEPRISRHANFHSGIEAPDGTVWIAGQEGLVYLQNDSLQSFKLNDKLLPVNYIITDKNGIIWMATNSGGILKCRFNNNNKPELIQTLSTSDGLASSNYLTLLVDHENNIWAGSSKGITLIAQTGKYANRIINFDETDGFTEPGYGYIRLYQDNKNRIWSATTSGITSFQPSAVVVSATPPVVYISGVKTKNNGWINTDSTNQYRFTYQNNSFQFNFTALDYADQKGVNYFYQLSGLDTGWVAAGMQRTVNYENLPPGNYTFRVRALSTKGSSSKEDAIFTFTIKKPVWQQWSFILLCCLIVIFILYIFILRREKAIKKRGEEKTEIEKVKVISYQHQLEIEQVLNFFAASISAQHSIDDMLWDVTKNCISKLGFEDCVIYLADDEKKVLIQKAAWGPKTTESNIIANPIKILFGKGIVGAVALNNKAEIINDTSMDSRYIVDDVYRLSEISVPIHSGDKVLGVIDSENSKKDFYTEKHLQILVTIASLIANRIVTIKASQLAKEKEIEVLSLKASNFQYQLEVEKIVSFFATAISSHHSVDDLLWDISKNLIGQFGFEDCMIYLWNEDKTLLLQKAGYGIKGSMQNDMNKEIYHVPKGKGIVGAAVESRMYILANDTSLDKRYYSADGKVQLSELCVPIIHNNEVIGAINTEHSTKNFYTDRHLQILITISSMLADKIDMIEAQEQTRKKEMEVLKLNKDLATSQLTALRAQMNPHFIFNALNSIQQYILQGNITEANRYLSKFSKLQREVLNHSDQNFISLEKELEVLNLYLELEQLRFDGNFNYEIKVEEAIDDDEIKIPPMIVQPFVENAIWHGLMTKQGDRWVHIHFSFSSDDILVCTVTDNGIGREAATRLKQNGHTQHKSKGLSLVYDRLSILQQQYGRAFEVTIKDLFVNNVPAGTEVKLHIYTG